MSRHLPPACPDCGASLPHSNPMAWQFHWQQVEKQRISAETLTHEGECLLCGRVAELNNGDICQGCFLEQVIKTGEES